ncbi:hypothetical protein [Persephonella sp. KM09-Lau-8]|uniref:hypothetical protein n=1 Tax=Persephonella sp. KM09-Lau-8 TaxID=1158345 RepID=UPI000497277A|nr:hypothetical protein [Persephonella sp. KM09-Lau-8]
MVCYCPACKEINETFEEITYSAHSFCYQNGEIKDDYPEPDLDYSKVVCRNCSKEFKNEPIGNFEIDVEKNNIKIPENLKKYQEIIKEKILKPKGDKNE